MPILINTSKLKEMEHMSILINHKNFKQQIHFYTEIEPNFTPSNPLEMYIDNPLKLMK